MIVIHAEQTEHHDAIRCVNQQTFPTGTEPTLVESLRKAGKVIASLVAIENGQVVGHVLFSPVAVETAPLNFKAAGLGPVAVLPSRQRQGIGSQLIRAGLEVCRTAGMDAVVVLGEPGYYSRFGFRRASDAGLRNEYGADEEFRVIELRPGAFAGVTGMVRYAPEFSIAS